MHRILENVLIILYFIRCVAPKDKAMALGLIAFAIGLFGKFYHAICKMLKRALLPVLTQERLSKEINPKTLSWPFFKVVQLSEYFINRIDFGPTGPYNWRSTVF